MKTLFLLPAAILILPLLVFSQEPVPPLVKNNFSRITSYDEISLYIKKLENKSSLLKVEVIGQSVKGKNLYGLMYSTSPFGKDTTKIRVLIFAQQHGDEQSGKEGALLLAGELMKPENHYLFSKIDLVIFPQINADGAEINQRRNANNADLNRNHLILSEPETIALHHLFDKYLFEVTLDVHEYSPYGEAWKKYGYRKNSDITVGTTTNINIAEPIRKLSSDGYLPFIFSYLNDRKFSSFEYCPGGPPEVDYIRHSTFDINDGRQSFGIQNTFSFIQEGMNGKDDSIENIRHRAEGQMTGMRGLLEYVYLNKDKIKDLVSGERKKLLSGDRDDKISVQSVHIANGEQLKIPLYSYYSAKDSLVTVKDYRPVVKSICDVKKPAGYLIPKEHTELVEWAGRQSLRQMPLSDISDYSVEEYFVTSIDSIDFEGDRTVNPQVTLKEIKTDLTDSRYIFIPANQLKGNLVVLALEPLSMLGLATYQKYAHLLKAGENYPVLRVVKK
ncbi:MAG: M14 family zinc carboxypeptidase [Bacteroidota bacterium]